MNVAHQALEQMAEGWRTLGSPSYIDEFVLKHGLPFSDAIPDMKRGIPKECYSNAGRRAMDDSTLIYCEGYCSAHDLQFPFLHAWLMNPSGDVVETTLAAPSTYDYFGFGYKQEFLLKQLVKYKVWGILGGAPQQIRALIEDTDPEEFLNTGFMHCNGNPVPATGIKGRNADQ